MRRGNSVLAATVFAQFDRSVCVARPKRGNADSRFARMLTEAVANCIPRSGCKLEGGNGSV